jgi:hypothetical protein
MVILRIKVKPPPAKPAGSYKQLNAVGGIPFILDADAR